MGWREGDIVAIDMYAIRYDLYLGKERTSISFLAYVKCSLDPWLLNVLGLHD